MDVLVTQLALGLGLQNVIGWFPPILLGVTNIIAVILAVFFYTDKSTEYNNTILVNDSDKLAEHSYDFIVVGGGSAGSIVANRLSKHFSVLLLERGGEPNPLTSVPGMEGILLGRPEVDYNYLTVPQNSSCLSCNNRQSQWNAGFGLGGSQNLNSMVYIRGHPFDYNRWSSLTNDKSWNYENILPYFLRSEGYCTNCENVNGPLPSFNPRFHNSKGELPVRPPTFSPMVSEYLEAMEWIGTHKGDYNAPYFNSIANVASYTQKLGRRMTSYKAFIDPIIGKRNTLKVVKYAQVTRVLFDSNTNRAMGVEYEQFGKIQVAKTKKEVILSAGAIGSPKILLLSGIGPQEDLNELKIPVRANLPVGRNLQDHVGTLAGPFLVNDPVSILADRDLNLEALRAFLQNGTGPLSVTFSRALSLWSSTNAVHSGEEIWPDVFLILATHGITHNFDQLLSSMYNLNPEVMREFLEPIKGRDAFHVMVSYGRPRSRGVLRLKSQNYNDAPLIDARYYEDSQQEDIRITVEMLQKVVHVCENAPSYKRLGSKLSPIPFPPCKQHTFRSSEYWECFARHYSLTLHHFSGTVAMGSKNSPNAVVDSKLRIIGTKGLRVMDASVMPYVVTANTNAATMMIAERGADFILESWTNQDKLNVHWVH